METLFGLKDETVVAQFNVTATNADKMYISKHFICLFGRVLGVLLTCFLSFFLLNFVGVGVEKKKVINLGHIQSCDLKKKILELQYHSEEKKETASLKITFKSLNERYTLCFQLSTVSTCLFLLVL